MSTSQDAIVKKLQEELGFNDGKKDQWQFELDSLSKVPTTTQAACDRCAARGRR